MQTIQLFIDNEQAEMFKDESVSLTDSIQNVRDIEKVFTAFSRSFSLPASKTNNKIFKHFYNSAISGFDARKKVSARIELNHLPFRTGKLQLEGVNLKDNKPHTYRVTFFGDIVELKDSLGEKKLSDLELQDYNQNYNATNIEDKLTDDFLTTGADIIAPLITHTQRLFYDSDQNNEEPDDGNLYWHSGGGNHIHGVKWNELKFAIRVNKIIEAIENDFDELEFSSDFFKNTDLDLFNNLFLWLHRKSGAVEDLSGSTVDYTTLIDGWTPTTVSKTDLGQTYTFTLTESTLTSDIPTFGTVNTGVSQRGLGIFKVTLAGIDTDPFNVVLQRDGETVFSQNGITTGGITISADPTDTYTFDYSPGTYKVIVTANQVISFTNIVWECTYYIPKAADLIIDSTNGATGAYNTNGEFTFDVAQQMPDMTILDFLKGLFRLFNLTAYVVDDVIQVKPLDDFYSGTNTYDITEFIDAESSQVDSALPFKEVSFKFKDTGTFLAKTFGERNNREWGSTFYKEGDDLSSGVYKVEAPFGHMLYERLSDQNGGAETNVQWGWCVDDSENAYLGSPLLFYPINYFIGSNGISFVNAVDNDNVASGHKEIDTVNMPHNTVDTIPSQNQFQLNFNREISEWAKSTEFTDSIFEKYYSDYIKSVFNLDQRLTKVKAYLPMRILLNYSLGDRFIINESKYKINSITTNLLTGESEIELLNDL